jgi:hypothetical protein
MNGLRKCGIYTQWNFTQPQWRMKFCHYNEMDGTGEHHLRWSYSGSEGRRQKVHVLSHMQIVDLKQVQ